LAAGYGFQEDCTLSEETGRRIGRKKCAEIHGMSRGERRNLILVVLEVACFFNYFSV
jgi:hypothetical protein